MNSVDKVKELCKEKKIAISRLEKDLGFSNGYIRGLREGKFPSDRLKAIAEYLGVSQNTYSQYENGVISISPEMLVKLADYFHVSVDYLLGRTNDRSPNP